MSRRLLPNPLFLRDYYGKKYQKLPFYAALFPQWHGALPLSQSRRSGFSLTHCQRGLEPFPAITARCPLPRVGSSHPAAQVTSHSPHSTPFPHRRGQCGLCWLDWVVSQQSYQQSSLTSVLCQVLPAAPHNHGRSVLWGPTELEYSFCPNRRSREQSKVPFGYKMLHRILLPELLDSMLLGVQ